MPPLAHLNSVAPSFDIEVHGAVGVLHRHRNVEGVFASVTLYGDVCDDMTVPFSLEPKLPGVLPMRDNKEFAQLPGQESVHFTEIEHRLVYPFLLLRESRIDRSDAAFVKCDAIIIQA